MPTDLVADAYRFLCEAVDALESAAGPGACDEDLVSVLPLCAGVARRLDRVTVAAAAALGRRGGVRSPNAATAAPPSRWPICWAATAATHAV